MAVSAILAVMGFKAGVIFAIRPSYNNGDRRAVHFFGILSSILTSLAWFPQYYEIYKHKEVIGISMIFVLVDFFGGVFSTLSLVFKEKFDVLAGIMYGLDIVSALLSQ